MSQRKSRKGSGGGEKKTQREKRRRCRVGIGKQNVNEKRAWRPWPWEWPLFDSQGILGRFCRKACACRKELGRELEGNPDLLALLVWVMATTS